MNFLSRIFLKCVFIMVVFAASQSWATECTYSSKAACKSGVTTNGTICCPVVVWSCPTNYTYDSNLDSCVRAAEEYESDKGWVAVTTWGSCSKSGTPAADTSCWVRGCTEATGWCERYYGSSWVLLDVCAY